MAGQRQQQLRMRRLYVPGRGGEQRYRPVGRCERGVLDTAQPPIHHRQSVQFNPFADCVDLDGVCEVVREIHHHGESGEQQCDRSTDRQPRKHFGPLPRGYDAEVLPVVEFGSTPSTSRGLPRASQIPWSGSRQTRSAHLACVWMIPHSRRGSRWRSVRGTCRSPRGRWRSRRRAGTLRPPPPRGRSDRGAHRACRCRAGSEAGCPGRWWSNARTRPAASSSPTTAKASTTVTAQPSSSRVDSVRFDDGCPDVAPADPQRAAGR
jgi:hypothetical protein